MPEAPRFTANTVTCRPSLGQEGRHTSENKSFASASLRCGTLRNEYKIERDAISLRPSLITLRHSILFSICRVARRARHCQDQKDRRRCIFALLDFGNYITPSCVPLIPHRHFFLRSETSAGWLWVQRGLEPVPADGKHILYTGAGSQGSETPTSAFRSYGCSHIVAAGPGEWNRGS